LDTDPLKDWAVRVAAVEIYRDEQGGPIDYGNR
jgi:hypothetical protein